MPGSKVTFRIDYLFERRLLVATNFFVRLDVKLYLSLGWKGHFHTPLNDVYDAIFREDLSDRIQHSLRILRV